MAEFICPKCQYIGKPGKKKRGGSVLGVLAWMIFPLGLPYTIWRSVAGIAVCKQCGNELLIALDSEVGRRLVPPLEDLYPEEKPPRPEEFFTAPAKKEQALAADDPAKDPDVW